MTFFDREDWRNWAPGCHCAQDLGDDVLALVAYTIAGGQTRYGIKCTKCGHINGGKPISPISLSPAERTAAHARLEDLAKGRESAEREVEDRNRTATIRRQAEREAEREKWWADYDVYLFTPEWRAKRAAVLKRDNYECQACCIAKATEVHHITYRHVFGEPLFDLVAVCRPCHEAITAIDRQGIPKEYRERLG